MIMKMCIFEASNVWTQKDAQNVTQDLKYYSLNNLDFEYMHTFKIIRVTKLFKFPQI